MSTLSNKLFVLAFASVAIASQACTFASPTTVEMVEKKSDEVSEDEDGTEPSSSGTGTSGTASTCGQKLVAVDISKLKACGTAAKGHCYPAALVPGAQEAAYEKCEGDEVCVADKMLTAGGKKAATCKSMKGKPGACSSILSTALKGGMASGIPQDSCDEGEACAPCIHPLTGDDSGACGEIGVFDKACDGAAAGKTETTPDPSKLCCTSGGKSNGVCASPDGLPEAAADSPQLECAAGLVCLPKAMADQKPVTCKAGTIMGKGVCMDKCFSDMLGMAGSIGFLSRENCGETEFCIPCSMASMQAGDQKIPGCE